MEESLFPVDPKQPKQQISAAEEVAYVGDTLKSSEGMDAEVVTWALYGMQKDPTMSVKQAIDYGYGEWVK